MNLKSFILLIFICSNSIFATKVFHNNGIVSSRNQDLVVTELLDNNGKIIAQEVIYAECGKLTGNGLFKAKNIEIITKDFNFTGTIECSQDCYITTKKPVDKSKFKMAGSGKFNFNVDCKLELPSQKPINVLPSFWKNVSNQLNRKPNVDKVCRFYLQIDMLKDNKNVKSIKSQFEKIAKFLSWEMKYSKNVKSDLANVINALPFDKIELGEIDGIDYHSDVEVFDIEQINESIDSKCKLSHATLAIFILFDSSQPEYNEILSRKDLTLKEKANLFFEGDRFILRNNLEKNFTAFFYYDCIA